MDSMNPGTDATNDAFKKFKETWEPSDELADKAKAEEKDLKRTEPVLTSVDANLRTKIKDLQTVSTDLRITARQLQDTNIQLSQRMELLENEIRDTRAWWDSKTDEIRKLMAMMMVLGFEINLD